MTAVNQRYVWILALAKLESFCRFGLSVLTAFVCHRILLLWNRSRSPKRVLSLVKQDIAAIFINFLPNVFVFPINWSRQRHRFHHSEYAERAGKAWWTLLWVIIGGLKLWNTPIAPNLLPNIWGRNGCRCLQCCVDSSCGWAAGLWFWSNPCWSAAIAPGQGTAKQLLQNFLKSLHWKVEERLEGMPIQFGQDLSGWTWGSCERLGPKNHSLALRRLPSRVATHCDWIGLLAQLVWSLMP